MADNPFLGVRLPPHIHQALLDRTAATGQNRSEIAIAALSAYLELPTENNDFTQIQQQLADVQQRLSAVESELSAVKQQQAIAPRPAATPRRAQQDDRKAIAPTADEAAAIGWVNQQQMAALVGIHKSTIASKRQSVSEAEFLAWLDSKSPHRWEFDRSLGKSGMYRSIGCNTRPL